MAVPWQLAVTRNWKDWLVSLSWSGEFELNCFAAVFLADISELSLPQISWNWSCLKYHEKGGVWRDFFQWTTTLQRSSNFQGRNHAYKRVEQTTQLFSLNSKYKRGKKGATLFPIYFIFLFLSFHSKASYIWFREQFCNCAISGLEQCSQGNYVRRNQCNPCGVFIFFVARWQASAYIRFFVPNRHVSR